MAEDPSEGPGNGAEDPRRRPRVAILLGFLGVFLLLLIVFRSVLFPFLMAIFIAYLIEPVVAAFTRAPIFGIRWTRGPTIVLMYLLLLGGIVTASSCTVAYVTKSAKAVTRDVGRTLAESAERARFSLEPEGEVPSTDEGDLHPPYEKDLVIPAGSRVLLRPTTPARGPDGAPPPPRIFTTLYELVVKAGETGGQVLLLSSEETPPAGATADRLLDPERMRFADDTEPPASALAIRVSPGEPATGLELFVERKLISPIVASLGRAGFRVQPTDLRLLLAAQARGLGEGLPDRAAAFGRDFITRVALSVYEFILILMLTAFIVMDRRSIAAFFASLPPAPYREAYHTLVRYVDRGLAGVIRGQLVICLVNGILTYLGLVVLRVPGAVAVSLLAGVLSLIPIFGTILSTIPIVLMATTDGIEKGLLALAWILFIHLLEANLLNPLIMGTHARMHPVIIIFALLAGERSFGVWGALLAVPTASILQSCFQFYRYEIEGLPPPPPPKPHGLWARRLVARVTGRAGAPPAPEEAS
jgi:predicted PurR-regulated permease PerM